MTAQSAARLVVEKEDVFSLVPMKGSTTLYQGALVVMDSSLAVPGRTATGLTAVGISEATIVNSGADGAARASVKRGVFKFANHGADAVVAGDVGQNCYIIDDQTVAKTSASSTRSIAGKVIDVDSDGVWVRVGY